jgi:hypothetical protein
MQIAHPNRAVRGLLLAATALLTACCGYRPDLPPTERVTGTVTLDGAPVPNARVQFVPDNSKGTEGAMAAGTTDADGRYELVTATVKGAIVGHHQVSVEARAQPKDEYDTLPELLTPARYSDHNSSALVAEVKAGEKNVVDLPLTSQPSDQ